MKKILSVVIFLIVVSLFSSTSAYASQDIFQLDTTTHINLLGKDRFAVDLKSNKLVFTNEPFSSEYDDIWFELYSTKNRYDPVLITTYERGKGNGATINLNGLKDGTYQLIIAYVSYVTARELLFYEDDDYDLHKYDDYNNQKDKNLYPLPYYDGVYFPSIEIKKGKADFKTPELFTENNRIAAMERTDVYALDYYKNKGDLDDFKNTGILKQANSIVAGITDDYEKARAIHYWVKENIEYDYEASMDIRKLRYKSAPDVLKGKITVCDGYANLTVALLQAVGIPAKKITGTAGTVKGQWDGHAWTQAYVDNRWVFMDTTWSKDYFDMPLSQYSEDHQRDDNKISADQYLWKGSLFFVDAQDPTIVLKEVKNFPLNGIVNSTYGFDIKDLYFDSKSKIPFKLGKMKVDSTNFVIHVDIYRGKSPSRVCYYIVSPDGVYISYGGDSFYKNFDYNYGDDDYYYYGYYGYTQIEIPYEQSVQVGKLLERPVDPILKGYTFDGWYNHHTGNKWNFSKDIITTKNDNMILMTRWKKASKFFKVAFNTNKGSILKTLTISDGTRLSKPKDPTRKGYSFTAWYKDAKYKTKWNFNKDIISANTTLYAGWQKTYTITFNTNGGTDVFDEIVKAKTVSTKPIATIRSGYKFLGWYKDASCTTKWDFKTDKVKADTTLYAGWKKNK